MVTVQQVIRNVAPHWVGDGFPVRSLFSYNDGPGFDPFLLLDYAGPYEFAPAEAKRGVGEHPHRGFETVTIVYQGELEHRDSTGSSGRITAGDVQWMTAAGGIVHEEFHSERFAREGGTLEMVQLWVNLPAKEKLSPPRYQEILAADIPTLTLPAQAGSARVIAGELLGTRGPAKTFTSINVWDLQLIASRSFNLPLPARHNVLLVVQTGDLQIDDEKLTAGELARLTQPAKDDVVTVTAETDSRVLVLTGEPIGESVVGQGPFVMNSREEIQAAVNDYRAGRMGHLA